MYNLGVLLQERGDLNGAKTWWTKAADLGHPGAMHNLGVLLKERGNLNGADTWYPGRPSESNASYMQARPTATSPYVGLAALSPITAGRPLTSRTFLRAEWPRRPITRLRLGDRTYLKVPACRDRGVVAECSNGLQWAVADGRQWAESDGR